MSNAMASDQEQSGENTVGLDYNPDTNYDEATMAQQRQIEKEITTTQCLIGNREGFSRLEGDYAQDDSVFQNKIQELKQTYQFFRRTRADGNCFYRAFGFAYLEKLLTDREELKRFKHIAARSKEDLVSLGFPEMTIEDFHDVFMEVLEKVEGQCSLEELLNVFNDQGHSDYLVVYLRLLVSGHLQKEDEFFMNFVEGGRTVKEFCNQEVEPMGKESDHIHIIALNAYTQVPVRVEYLDRGNSVLNHHDFPEGSHPYIHLLYKPGHYDILYK